MFGPRAAMKVGLESPCRDTGRTVLLTERDPAWNGHNQNPSSFRGLAPVVAIPVQVGPQLQCEVETGPAGTNRGQPGSIDPLYLFACGLLWHKQADAGAGWELVRGLKASGLSARVAAVLLADTGNPPPRIRSACRTRSGTGEHLPERGLAIREVSEVAVTMNAPYGLEIIENCVTCKLRKDKWFCGLSPGVLKSFRRFQPLEYVPWRRGLVRGGPDATRRAGAVLGQGQTLDHLSRWQGVDSPRWLRLAKRWA